MLTDARKRLNSASGPIALVALFVALGGSAYALQANSVGTKELKNRAVTTPKIAPKAVTGPRLAPAAVKAGRIANGAVISPKIANGAVTAPKIADGALGTPGFASSIPAVSVTRASAQAIPNATDTTLSFPSERYDTAGMHNGFVNSSRLVAPTAGIYLIDASVLWDASATGVRSVSIVKNGNTALGSASVGSTGFTSQVTSRVTRLQQGDSVQVRVAQNSGGSLAIDKTVGEDSPSFTMTWVAPGP